MVADKETEQKVIIGTWTRGKVQNLNARVELQPKFVLTYYEKPYEVQRPVYFSPELEKANSESGLAWKLRITNNEAGLNELQIQTHFRSINNYSKQIEENPHNAMLYFGRGIDYMLIQDYANAFGGHQQNGFHFETRFIDCLFLPRAVIRAVKQMGNARCGMAQQKDRSYG